GASQSLSEGIAGKTAGRKKSISSFAPRRAFSGAFSVTAAARPDSHQQNSQSVIRFFFPGLVVLFDFGIICAGLCLCNKIQPVVEAGTALLQRNDLVLARRLQRDTTAGTAQVRIELLA
ncbi:hypothetical protein BaRGS_00024370, partial [Batillaria attramentaria]